MHYNSKQWREDKVGKYNSSAKKVNNLPYKPSLLDKYYFSIFSLCSSAALETSDVSSSYFLHKEFSRIVPASQPASRIKDSLI